MGFAKWVQYGYYWEFYIAKHSILCSLTFLRISEIWDNVDHLMQGCGIPIANSLEIPLFFPNPSTECSVASVSNMVDAPFFNEVSRVCINNNTIALKYCKHLSHSTFREQWAGNGFDYVRMDKHMKLTLFVEIVLVFLLHPYASV